MRFDRSGGSLQPRRVAWLKAGIAAGLALAAAAAYLIYPTLHTRLGRIALLGEWLRNSLAHPEWAVQAGTRCGQAPFLLPSSGYIGFVWGDSFRLGHRHQGIDIFGGTEAGQTPVLAAYSGYLTRLPDWRSAVILRIPEDPLQPERQIWLYYAHMADQNGISYIAPQFPPGTREVYVEAGTQLGFQGNYSGDPLNPTGVHLHFSIVLDDGRGGFKNELDFRNTLDPSPYLGLPLNAASNLAQIRICGEG